MLTLEQVQEVHNTVMFDELVMVTAAPIIDADDPETRVAIAERIAMMTIVVTLDTLARYISEIPSADELADAIIAKTVNDFLSDLDN